MTRASEVVGGGRKSGSQTPTPSALAGAANKEYPFPAPTAGQAAAAAPKGRSNGQQNSTPSLPATPDPSHLSDFSLKLSELVNQSLTPTVAVVQHTNPSVVSVTKHATGRSSVPKLDQITYEGKKLPNRAKVQAIAQLVSTELRYASAVDAYLLRAVSRAALKALTLFANRIDSLLVPAAKDPTILIMPSTAKEGIHLSAALEYNIGLAATTWIIEDALENCIEGDDRADASAAEAEGLPAFVSEILTPVRKKMETTILHVIQPILAGVKTSLTASLLKAVQHPFIPAGSPALTPSVSNESPLPPVSPGQAPASTFASPKGADATSSGNWLKELQGRLEGSRKLLVPRIEARTSQDGEGWFISVAVHLIWKGLFVLTARPSDCTSTQPLPKGAVGGGPTALLSPAGQHVLADAHKRSPSPGQLSAALRSVTNVGNTRARRAESGTAVPSGLVNGSSGWSTPGDARVDGTVSPVGVSQPKLFKASPSIKSGSQQLADLQALQKMTLRFCKGFVTDKAMAAVAAELSRADADDENEEDLQDLEDEEDELARQALAEALEALNSTIIVIQAIDSNSTGVKAALQRIGRVTGGDGTNFDTTAKTNDKAPAARPLDAVQLRALKAIPPLLLLHIVYCRLPAAVKTPFGKCDYFLPPPPALFGLSWSEYERSIAGFVGGTSWAQAAITRWQKAAEEVWQGYSAARKDLLALKAAETDADNAADDLGTTPTPARIAATQAATTRPDVDSRLSSTDSLATRDSQHFLSNVNVAELSSPEHLHDANLMFQSDDGARSDRSSSTASSTRPTPDQSPHLGALAVEDLESSTGSLSLKGSGQDASKPAPKQRFWKSSSAQAVSQADGGNSGATATPSMPPPATRGFHLPSLSRPSFGSRNSSPGGSLRSSLGARSRSSRRAAVSEVANSVVGEEDNREATDVELAELDRLQDAVAFFGRVLEWSGWCAGMEVKCHIPVRTDVVPSTS